VTTRSVVHASFTITRRWKAAPARVFAAFADEKQKDKWFAGPGSWVAIERKFDFREGGHETLAGKWNTGMVTRFDCVYRDIVPPAGDAEGRIIYSYNMFVDDKKISVSLATMQLKKEDRGTKLMVSEQGAFLDGYDDAGSREHGTGYLLDKLGAALSV